MIIHARKISIPLKGDIYEQAPDGEEFAYWILDKKTFNDLWTEHNNIPDLNKKIKDLKKQRDDAIKERDEANQIANDNYEFVQQHKADMDSEKKAIDEIRKESEANQRTLDEVLRIVKERANKDRHLNNKKNNVGYVILSSEDYSYNLYKKNWGMYKTTFQTPFPAELNKADVAKLRREDTDREEYFKKIDIGPMYQPPEYNQSMDFESTWKADLPFRVKTMYKRNFVKGYWEASVVHIKEISL